MKVQILDCIYVIRIMKLPKKQHYCINKVCVNNLNYKVD
jgi:hypothetical protein